MFYYYFMQSSLDRISLDSEREKPIDRLSVYDYQLTPQSELQVDTTDGLSFTLRKLGVNLAEEGTHLIVAAASDRDFVGCFGIPFRGISVGRSYDLYGEFGMVSASVARLRASNVLPDTVSASAMDLVRQYSSRLPIGQELLDDLSRRREAISRGDFPHVILTGPSNDQQMDSASLHAKVSAMVRGIAELVDQKQELPFNSREIEELQHTFGKLIRSQCFHPHSGMVQYFQKPFVVRDNEGREAVPHELYALFRLDGSSQAFSVKKVSP